MSPGYLKIYQLSRPVLNEFDCLLIDEAQDCTPGKNGNTEVSKQCMHVARTGALSLSKHTGKPQKNRLKCNGDLALLLKKKKKNVFVLTEKNESEITTMKKVWIGDLNYHKIW